MTAPIPHQATIEAEQKAYVLALEAELKDFFTRQEGILGQITPEALPLLDAIRRLSTGGKRLRALLCYWGWRGAGGSPLAPEIIRAGAAIELFQSAALIHDDIIDRSETRRGAPAVHKWFENQHQQENWRNSAAEYGSSVAIITGDLCLSWSEEMFSSIGPLATSGTEARHIFNLMRTEVMAGQYLDILGEVIPSIDAQAAQERAELVVRYKAAKYSCEHPLALGGALAGKLEEAEENQLLTAYRAFALPLGEGFQLRDDVLGVFGKPQETGKPAGDDLAEGKRTVLIALTEKLADTQKWQQLDQALGQQNLTAQTIAGLQEIIISCGALAQLEEIILAKEAVVDRALADIPVPEEVRIALSLIAAKALHRSA